MSIRVVSINDRNYLKGVQLGDEVRIYNSLGQLLDSFVVTGDMEELMLKGIVVIKVKSGKYSSVLKTVL